IRQVDVVARMVDEFSAFARMPKPEMSLNDIIDVVRGPVDLQQLGNNANIAFDIDFPAAPVTIQCDPRMINQVITNLVKNASEAVEAKALKDDTPADYRGRIGVSIVPSERDVVIEVVDNGIGLPKANRGRLTEPYITHREKGTGLGLAIVLKVIEQHGGKLALEDAPLNETRTSGALIRITLPRPDPTTTSPEPSKREAPQPAATTLSPAR
ncbi:MAG: ATP-binding protein, partial [Pseudomonadota bacterium]